LRQTGQPATNGNGTMVAFSAATPRAVDAFHQAGMAHGGTSEGAPAYRDYGKNFYATIFAIPMETKSPLYATLEHERI
jgi:predicted lactoylglutathione lyase